VTKGVQDNLKKNQNNSQNILRLFLLDSINYAFLTFFFGNEPPKCIVFEEDYQMLCGLQQIRHCTVVTHRFSGVSRLNFHRGCTGKKPLKSVPQQMLNLSPERENIYQMPRTSDRLWLGDKTQNESRE